MPAGLVMPNDTNFGIQIGDFTPTGYYFYKNPFDLDEVALWSRVLSASEVLQHYDAGLAGLNYFTQAITATLAGSVTDDGLPAGGSLSATWSEISGPSSVAFGNPVSIFPDVAGQVNQVQTPATFSTPGTYSLSLTGSDSQLSRSANVIITVNPLPTPAIALVNPNSGSQGKQNLSVNITGQFTHFVSNATTATFGAGITVASLTVNSATSATVILNIDLAAAAGMRNVTLTTGAEVVTLTNGFTVTNGTPILTQVSPNTGQQGQQDLSVTVTGQLTHFLQGTTTANFGVGVTVVSLTVNSSTSATAVLNIDPAAVTNVRDVTLTTNTEVVTLGGGFTVTSGAPALMSVNPNTAQQGQQNLLVAITGQLTHFVQGTTTASFGDGISVGGAASGSIGPVTVTGPTSATALLNISSRPDWAQLTTSGPTPAQRFYQYSVYDPTSNQLIVFGGLAYPNSTLGDLWRLSHANGLGGSPAWTQVTTTGPSPSPRGQGSAVYDQASDRMIIFGGSAFGGTSSSSNEVWVLSNASGRSGNAAWSLLSPAGGSPSPRSAAATVYDPSTNRMIIMGGHVFSAFGDVWVLSNANGLGGPPTWTQLSPSGPSPGLRNYASTVYDGSSNRMILYGGGSAPQGDVWVLTNANGLGGTPTWAQLLPSGVLPVQSSVNASWYDAVSNRMLIFGGGCNDSSAWILSGANGLSGPPAWTKLGPFGALPGARYTFSGGASTYDSVNDRLVVFGGAETNFTPATAYADTWVLSSAIRGASTGPRTVTVQTGTEIVSLTSGFSVLPSVTTPSAMLEPACGPIGSSVSVNITGENTNFVQGSTLANFGPTVSVGGGTAGSFGPVNVTSPTTATAQVTIAAVTPISVENVVVRTGAVDVSPANGFFVSNLTTPLLLSVNPNSGQQGQQSLSVAINALNTHFSQSTTQVDLGSGITTGTVTVTSLTSLTVVVNIDNNANLGFRTVSVTTGTEVASLANGFAVAAAGASITTVGPNSGQQGQGGPVRIVGQNTHFAQGTTQVDFGPDITVSAINVTCGTCLTLQLQIATTAVPGPRTVTVTTGSEVATLSGGFTVLPGTPILTSLNRAAGQQGQTFPVTITGQFTHFTQGTTQVSFGAGMTVTNITVSSPTSLTAQLAIDASATLGTRTLTVTTGTEIVSVPNVFTVQQATPILSSLSPGSGQPGQQNLSVSIVGQNTHFVQGASQVSFGAGITVVSIAVSGPTVATALVNIDSTAALGTRTVAVTTGTEVASFNNGFTVVAGTPTILSVNPGGSQQGRQTLSVALVGQFTNWVQGTTTADFGSGVTVTSLTVNSSSTATAVVNIDPTAATGPRTVTLTTGTEVATFLNGFTVTAGTTALTQVNPNSGLQGQQNLSIAITGQFTHFVQGTTTASFGAGITVASLTVNAATSATAVVNIDPAAAPGTRDVTVTTGTEILTATSAFTVSSGSPALIQANPNSGQQGQQNLGVMILGQFTHFAQGTTTASFGTGVTVASLTVNSATSATAVLNIDSAAATGPRNVTLTTNSEVVTLTNGFAVTTAAPSLISVSPNSGQQGQQNLSVGITGQFTHFAQGSTTASFGAGITVASLAVNSATSATAVLNIDAAAATGVRNVTITTNVEVVTLTSGFTVLQSANGPAILSVTPNSGLAGQSIQVIITAQNTHFVQGTTQINFGPEISVGGGPAGGYGSVQVLSSTAAVAQVSVPNNAALGPRTVAAQTGSEQADIFNGFVVTGAPYISFISPSFAQKGQSISATITGVFTNFQQGVTQVSFGAGISVGGATEGGFGPVSVTGPTSATAQLTINAVAAPGLRTQVTAQTGAEQASLLDSGFLVLGPVTGPGPLVTITSPTEGTEITAPTNVTGTVTSPNLSTWTLEYEASGSTVFTQFASGTTSSVNGTLDPTLLLNGIAQIRLTGVDQSGQTTSEIVDVVLTRNVKVGNFTLSFNDLTVPVAGIPIQIIRTYDSRNKSSGDFGFGWSLDIKTIKVDANGILGNAWIGTTTGGAFPTYCVQPSKNYVVSVRLPDGTVYQFAQSLNGGCQQLAPPSTVDMAFTPMGNTPLNATLTATNGTGLFVSGSFPGQVQLIDLSNVQAFDPDQFTLTLPDGRKLLVSETFLLQSITDTNNNKLTVSASGIVSSTGKGVSFTRDAQNRITTITDPSGHILNYAYDGNGDLATFTDQLNNVSSFTYDNVHDLLTFNDPGGIQPIRNVYDDAGRADPGNRCLRQRHRSIARYRGQDRNHCRPAGQSNDIGV